MPNASSRRSALPWISIAAACLVVAGVTLWRAQARPVAVAPPAADLAPEAPPAVRIVPSQPTRSSSAPADPAAIADASVREHARVQGLVDDTRERFIARHASERVDTAWSNTMERELVSLADSDQIRAMHANVANLDVDCRTSMCRVSGDVPSITAGDDWFTLYMTNVGGAMPEATYRYMRNPDGSLRIEVFGIARR
ncbi:MAG TPA: hypothetical protein VJW16_07810 [Lysobacter sp.]|nr:hypothetical protein [Lysobacter sp.]